MNILQFLRQFKIGEYAIFDTAISLVVVYFLAPYLSKLFKKIGIIITRKSWMYLVLPISVIVHLIFSTSTPLTRNFFDPSGHFLEKLVGVVLLVLGAKDIRFKRAK